MTLAQRGKWDKWDKAARWLMLAALIAIGIAVNHGIYAKEEMLAQGARIVLELAPADPRSLMQGDYMRLRFAVAEQMREAVVVEGQAQHVRYVAVVAPDAQGVARFVRIDAAAHALTSPEQRLEFRVHNSQVRVVTDAWFFQEGQGQRFAQARYGELRADADGQALLVQLLDAQLRPL